MKTQTRSTLETVLLEIYCHLNTPTSLGCWLRFKHGVLGELVAMTINPLNYLDTVSGAKKFAKDYQAVKLLSKFDILKIKGLSQEDLVKKAIAAFYEGEKRCAATNIFLRNLRDWDPLASEAGPVLALREILRRTKKITGRILGKLDQAKFNLRFGPGTTAELSGGSTFKTVLDKLAHGPTVTPSATEVFKWFHDATPWEASRMEAGLPYLSFIEGNKFTVVPKKATALRGIASEPGGNLLVQLGVGGYMKGRLSRWGIYVDRSSTVSPTSWANRVLINGVLTRRAALREQVAERENKLRSRGQEVHGRLAL